MEDNELKTMVTEIHRALVGDPQYKQEGLIDKVQQHEKRIKRQETYVIGITAIFGAMVFILKFWNTLANIF